MGGEAMKIKVRTGNQNRLRLNEKLANEFQINNGDVFDVDITPNQILLTKLETEQQIEQSE